MQYLIELYFYFFFGGATLLIIMACLAIISLPVPIITGMDEWRMRLLRGGLVLTFALLFGAIVNSGWFLFFSERLYHMGDPLVHFSPFLPFGWWSLDRNCGGRLLQGVQMWQLQVIWSSCAIVVWCLAAQSKTRVMRSIAG